ncbi:MAG: hypothetical protein AAB870_00280 [Patescibacteria group bacterium]
MSDNFWFFPKQQNVQGAGSHNASVSDSIVPEAEHVEPLMPSTPQTLLAQDSGMRSLDEALLEIEHDMPSVSVSAVETKPAEQPVEHTTHPARPRLDLLKHTLEDIKKNVQKALDLINDEQGGHHHTSSDHHLSQLVPGMAIDTTRHTYHPGNTPSHSHGDSGDTEHAIEGIFDGQAMIGPDGKQYAIPPNYASKSKLVEGDVLKLNISHNGSFLYKQVGPIARRRVMGTLETDPETHTFVVKSEGHFWRVITASVTYFKGVVGDEAVILVPRDKPSKWAAVENIIKKF